MTTTPWARSQHLKQNGRTDVQVYSFNTTAPAIQAVKDGTMTATLGVDLTSAGKQLVDQIPDIIKAGDAWQPKSFIPGYTIVTKDNVDEALKSAPGNRGVKQGAAP